MNIKLRNAFSTKSDRKITISIFTTRLLSSQQLMDFFFNFSYGSFFCFFLTSYSILVYQFLNSWDNIARVITLRSFVLDAPENTAQKKNPIQCCLNLIILLGQHSSGKNLMQKLPKKLQATFDRKNLCSMNTLGTKLHR